MRVVGGVFVVGSINQDFVLAVERRPEPGETVTDARLTLLPGGKGANAAVAAARLGADVSMLGRIGEDSFGEDLAGNLRANGVRTDHVEPVSDAPTGSAFITVTPDGENAIVVSPGANRSFGPEEVREAAEQLRGCAVLVAQLEVPVGAVEAAANIVAEGGGRFLFNLAPAREVPESLLRLSDPLVVNETEARFLAGKEGRAADLAEDLLRLGPRSAVVTLGAEGAVLASEDGTEHFPAPEVEAVDTTGAGDAFVGALAARLAAGASLEEAAAYAVLAGSAAVAQEGAQGALPTPEDLEILEGG